MRIFIATGVAMAAAVLQIVWLKLTGKAIEAMHWINLTVILVFGGATHLAAQRCLHQAEADRAVLVVRRRAGAGALFFRRNLIRGLMEKQIQLPDPAWEKLNLVWAGFFLRPARSTCTWPSGQFTESQWSAFKAFGLMGLMIVFVIGQSLWLGKHIQPGEETSSDSGASAASRNPDPHFSAIDVPRGRSTAEPTLPTCQKPPTASP